MVDDAQQPESAGLAGRSIGPYRLVRELGHGGQGFVYLAVDERLDREVALKVLAHGAAISERARLRFLREAEVASKLDHPGICTVYEFGEHEGVPFIAMQYVRGRPIDARIAESRSASGGGEIFVGLETEDGTTEGATSESISSASTSDTRGRAELDEILAITEKVARALHVAHEAGLVHRDIKPGNIMVTEDGEPVILDFGLARDESSDSHDLTQTGEFMGTPAYMSPEQLVGQRIGLDRRTDIYSLGVTLYEHLTLQRPFEAPTRQALYQQILTHEPPDPRRIDPNVTRDMRVVLETALDKMPDRRYQTAGAMADDIARLLAGEPITARPQGPVTRFTRWVGRRPAVAAVLLLALVGIALLAHAVGSRREAELEKRARLLEQADRERVEDEKRILQRDRDDARMLAALRSHDTRRLSIMRFATWMSDRRPDHLGHAERLLASFREFGVPLDDERPVEEVVTALDDVMARSPDLWFRMIKAAREIVSAYEEAEITRALDVRQGIVPAWAHEWTLERWRKIADRHSREIDLAARLGRIVHLADRDPWRRRVWGAYRAVFRSAPPEKIAAHVLDVYRDEPTRSAWDWLWLASLVADLEKGTPDGDLAERAIGSRPDLIEAHLARVDGCLPSFREQRRFWGILSDQIRKNEFKGIPDVDADTMHHHSRVAIALDPSSPYPRIQLALTEFLRGNADEAAAAARRAIELGDPTHMAHLILGYALLVERDAEGAVAVATEVALSTSRESLAFEPAVELLFQFRRYDVGVRAAEALVEREPDDPAAHAMAGICRAIADKDEEARASFRRAIELEGDPVGLVEMSRIILRRGQEALALEAATKALTLEETPDGYLARAAVLAHSGKPDEAISDLESVLRMAPHEVVRAAGVAIRSGFARSTGQDGPRRRRYRDTALGWLVAAMERGDDVRPWIHATELAPAARAADLGLDGVERKAWDDFWLDVQKRAAAAEEDEPR